MVSLVVKSTTQSTIVRKLSSYTKKNRTKRALWELDNIISSLHALNYIDSPELRRNTQRAINRGESYHRLKRAVFHDNFVSRQNWNSTYGVNVPGFLPIASSSITAASFPACLNKEKSEIS